MCLGCGLLRASVVCLVAPGGVPRLVRSDSSQCSGRHSHCHGAFTSTPDLLGGCAGLVEAGREAGSWCLPLAPAEAGALSLLRVIPVRGLTIGLSLAGPSSFGLGLRALRWFGVYGRSHSRVPFPAPFLL